MSLFLFFDGIFVFCESWLICLVILVCAGCVLWKRTHLPTFLWVFLLCFLKIHQSNVCINEMTIFDEFLHIFKTVAEADHMVLFQFR